MRVGCGVREGACEQVGGRGANRYSSSRRMGGAVCGGSCVKGRE
jgi:hypothetical protein